MTLPADADIPLCLVELGLGNEDWGPTTDTYANLSANWRGTSDCPSESELETAWDTVKVNIQMTKMREERDRLLVAMDWRIQRNYQQVQASQTPTDDSTKMTEIYTYMQDLRDMPQDNPGISSDAEYNALTWPEEPS